MTDQTNTEAQGGGMVKKGCLGIAGILVVLVIIGMIAGPPEDQNSEQIAFADDASTGVEEASNPLEIRAEDPVVSNLTGPQRNALRSAKQYISMTGFSREGLIEQLSSSYGDDYDVADATVAVDNLNIDWNEQAARSAQSYLEMTGFSCNGLIEQLSSDAGDKYTASEARYGAQLAGAC